MVEKLPFLSNDHHFAITKVAIYAARMEHLIEYVVTTALSNQKATSEYLLRNLSTDRLVGMLEAVLTDTCPEDEAIAPLISRIRQLRTDRNEILHWLWSANEDPTSATHASYRPHRPAQSKRKSAEEIDELASELNRVSVLLTHWLSIVQRTRR